MSVTCEAGYPQTDRECAWCGASREQSCRRPPPDPRLAEINKLRAELAEAKRDAERYRWLTLTSDTNPLMVYEVASGRLLFGYEADVEIDIHRYGGR